MRQGRVACAITFASVLLVVSPDARAGDPVAAREQVKIGYLLAQEGKCPEAIPHFQESLRLDAKAITLINLAQCEEKIGKLADALGHWVDARARAQSEGNAAIEAEAEKRAKTLEPKLPKLTLALAGAPPGAEVVRDGTVLGPASMGVALPVNPGAHTMIVRAPGYEDTTESVTLAEGENKRVELKLGAPTKTAVAPVPGTGAKDDATGGTSPLVYVGFGVALVGIGVGSVTGIMALGRGSDAKDSCPGGRCVSESAADDAKGGQTLGTISTIGFVGGGVGAAVGIYGLVWGKPKSSASVAVSVGPNGGSLRGTF